MDGLRRIFKRDSITPVRFSMRTMFFGVTIVTILCASSAFRLQQRRAHELAASWFKQGVIIAFDDWYRPRAAWTMPSNRVTDTLLARLASLTDLRSVSLRDSQVTDAGIVQLKQLTSLQQLLVGGLPITDVGVAQMAGIRSLQEIDLIGTDVTPKGIIPLTELPDIQYVRVHADMVGLAKASIVGSGMNLVVGDQQFAIAY